MSRLRALGHHGPLILFDTAIGQGVDATGVANLPLGSSGRYIYVGNGGSDGANGLTHATRKATVVGGQAAITAGNGDQVLFAEGNTFTDPLGWVAFESGQDAAHPTVFQSYDPTDPTNTAKFGRAHERNLRPIFTASPGQISNGTFGNIAFRSLNFNPGNNADQGIDFVGFGSVLLFENMVFDYIGLSFDTGESGSVFPHTPKLIVRNCALHGMWSSSTSAHTGGLYSAGYDGPTLEDNVFSHCGWNEAITRAETNTTLGTPTVFNHSYYIQTNSTNAIVRRNLSHAGSGDGGISRGDTLSFTENLFIDNPAAIGLGGGPTYNADRPTGVGFQCSFNAMIGTDEISPTDQLGWGINTTNGTSGSRVHHNMMVRSLDLNGPNMSGFSNNADFNQPSFAQYDHNLIWNWVSQANQTNSFFAGGGSFPAQSLATYDQNVWDGQALGTNVNSASWVNPNAYTKDQLAQAQGFADMNAFIAHAIAFPQDHIQRIARANLFSGYGMANIG